MVRRDVGWLTLGFMFFYCSSLWAQEAVQPSRGTLLKILDLIVEATVKYSFQVMGGIFVLIIGWFVGKFLANIVQKFLEKYKIDVTVTKFLVSSVKLIVLILAGLVALGKFGVEIAPFIAGLSVVGFATSFALQGPLSNYAAGATLIFTKPFKVGDIIEVVNQMGEVLDMTLPRTILKTVDGTVIVIPNKHIIGEIIHNFSDYKMLDIKVGVAYNADVHRAIEVVRAIIKSDTRLHNKHEPKIGIVEFGESSVNLFVRLWCKQSDYWDAMFAINKNIFEEFKRQGISIPFPQRDVHVYHEKPLA